MGGGGGGVPESSTETIGEYCWDAPSDPPFLMHRPPFGAVIHFCSHDHHCTRNQRVVHAWLTLIPPFPAASRFRIPVPVLIPTRDPTSGNLGPSVA